MISVIDILHDTVVDGPGFRTTVYCAGCENRCAGCHNPQSWDMAAGTMMSEEAILDVILSDPFADVTFSGGDPMLQAAGFARLAKMIREKSRKTIWCYTGYTFENLVKRNDCLDLLRFVDVLVDGRFEKDLRDESLYFRGSSNQRLIDVGASLSRGEVVEYDYSPAL